MHSYKYDSTCQEGLASTSRLAVSAQLKRSRVGLWKGCPKECASVYFDHLVGMQYDLNKDGFLEGIEVAKRAAEVRTFFSTCDELQDGDPKITHGFSNNV
jgi:hypothetical protein